MEKLTLEEWRKAKSVSQESMAEALKIHINTYRTWEKNPGKIGIDDGIKISKILNVPFDDIFFGDKSTNVD